MPKQKFTTTIDSDLLEQIKIQAIKEKRSVSSLLETMIKDYLAHLSSSDFAMLILGFDALHFIQAIESLAIGRGHNCDSLTPKFCTGSVGRETVPERITPHTGQVSENSSEKPSIFT